MVIQKTIDTLKEKPNDEKKAVAGGIAFAVVVILFFGWAFFFFKKIQGGAPQQLGGNAADEFLGTSVRDAQHALMQDFSDLDELRRARDQGGGHYQQATLQENLEQSDVDQFGSGGTID